MTMIPRWTVCGQRRRRTSTPCSRTSWESTMLSSVSWFLLKIAFDRKYFYSVSNLGACRGQNQHNGAGRGGGQLWPRGIRLHRRLHLWAVGRHHWCKVRQGEEGREQQLLSELMQKKTESLEPPVTPLVPTASQIIPKSQSVNPGWRWNLISVLFVFCYDYML